MWKIKPCPFCGGKAVLKQIQGGSYHPYYVRCNSKECFTNASTDIFASPESAIRVWNHRPGEEDAYRRGVQRLPMEGDDKE